MAYIPEEVIQDVLSKVNILDIISRYVNLEKRGKNYFGLCPFHEENTPSFTVQEEKQIFKCFSCGRGGNVFRFMMELEGYGFVEAVQRVVEMANVPISFTFSSPKEKTLTPQEERLISLYEEVTTLYHYLLMETKEGLEGRRYLEERQLSKETLEAFRIGVSPVDDRFVSTFLTSKGYTTQEMEDSGIFTRYGEELRDRFSGRVIFPLIDENHRVIGYSGRLLPVREDPNHPAAKYLNSPETLLFKKRDFLFHLYEAKEEARRAKEIILFEGFMDVIQATQAGVKNGVASLGTSLTDEQIHLLKKHSPSLLLAYDGDDPGQEASVRAIDNIRAKEASLTLHVLRFPKPMDPDEFIKTRGEERFVQFISEQALTPLRFLRSFYLDSYQVDTDEGKLNYIQTLLRKIRELSSNPVEEDIYLKELSQDTNVEVETLRQQLAQIRINRPSSVRKSRSTSVKLEAPSVSLDRSYNAIEKSELHLFNRLLYYPDTEEILEIVAPNFSFNTPTMEMLYVLWQDYRDHFSNEQVIDFYSTLSGDEEQRLTLDSMNLDIPGEPSEKEIGDLVYKITDYSDLEKQLEEINQKISHAKANHDDVQRNQLSLQKLEIIKKLKAR